MYNNLQRKRVVTSVAEIENLIHGIDEYGLEVVCLGAGQKYSNLKQYKAEHQKTYKGLKGTLAIKLSDTKLEITSYYGDEFCKPCTYIFDLNEEAIFAVSGHMCFKEFAKTLNIPKAADENYRGLSQWYDGETGRYVCSASPILGFNPKYENQELTDCYEYDLNSAYSSVLLDKVPDLESYYYECKVGKNQVGFLYDDELTLVESGYADIVFDLIPAPDSLKAYINKWYTEKSKAPKGSVEKLTAKAYLNLPIGYCQRYNPFLRSYIVNKCNKAIKNIINDDTLFWNTDAIFSKVKREDLNIGTAIGQFKEVKCSKLRYIQNTYQVNDEIPVYRGIPKKWFEYFEQIHNRKFDLLTDRPPAKINKWTWDWEKLELKETEIFNEQTNESSES